MINQKKRFLTISFYFGMWICLFSSQWMSSNVVLLKYWFTVCQLTSPYFFTQLFFSLLLSRYVLPSTGTWIEQPQEWAQCELCHKWRKLAQGVYASTLPDVWTCSQNSRSLWVCGGKCFYYFLFFLMLKLTTLKFFLSLSLFSNLEQVQPLLNARGKPSVRGSGRRTSSKWLCQ